MKPETDDAVGIVQKVARYAEETLSEEGFRFTSAVVANCRMLAVQQNEHKWRDKDEDVEREVQSDTHDDAHEAIDMDALVIAGYLHDISTVAHGYNDHQRESARMAAQFLRQQLFPSERISRVEQAILHHATLASAEQRSTIPIEARILYDADRLGRLSGLSVVTSLIEFGARYPDRPMTSDILTAILRHIEEKFIDLYQSLYTKSAREMAREKFGKVIAFLDGVIEYLSEATPI